jgi:hypothetical protein
VPRAASAFSTLCGAAGRTSASVAQLGRRRRALGDVRPVDEHVVDHTEHAHGGHAGREADRPASLVTSASRTSCSVRASATL